MCDSPRGGQTFAHNSLLMLMTQFLHQYHIICETHQLLTFLPLCFQTSDPSEHFNRQDSHTQSGSGSRATQSLSYRNPSTGSSSTHQTQTRGLPQDVEAQHRASDGGVPPGLAGTLEHIIGQLDILTQVSRRCASL